MFSDLCNSLIELFQLMLSNLRNISSECHSFKMGSLSIIWLIILLYNFSDIPSVREYRNMFGITEERLLTSNREIAILHPGPINRGVEIDSRVADSDNAVILDQVLNGVASRMSILYLLLGEGNIKL